MPRPRKAPEEKVGTHAYSVRLPQEVAARVEHIRRVLQENAPFAKVTTTDVLRHLITEASAQSEWGDGDSFVKIAGQNEVPAKGRKRLRK